MRGPETAKQGSGRKRYPWLTKDDMVILAALDAVDPEVADEFERLIREQATADAMFYDRVRLECDLGAASGGHHRAETHLEYVHGIRAARWNVGAGGGHHRRHIEDAVF